MSTQLLAAPQLAPLQFSDSTECARWIERLPLTNVQQAQRLLQSQIAALHAADFPGGERLKILERLHQPITFIQGECASRYVGRPLPLDAAETALWRDVVQLWHATLGNYQQCLAAYRAGDTALEPHAALILARLLRLIGCQMVDHYRVYHHVPGALWAELHALYLAAEQFDLLHACVSASPDPKAAETTCARVYMEVLLTHLANPYGLSDRQLGFVLRWAAKWSGLVPLKREPLPGASATALAVDLDGAVGATFASTLEAAANLRYLDIDELGRALRQVITALKQGQTPAQLGLGSHAQNSGCESLLMLLYVQWCRAGTSRIEEREEADEDAAICFGMAASHAQLRGAGGSRPTAELTSREKRDLDTFGYVIRAPSERVEREQSPIDACKIGNQSLSGCMCVLRNLQGAGRVTHNQVVTLRRGAPVEFRLGIVQWMRVEATGELRCGVRLFPGAPQSVTVRPANVKQSNNNGYERALLLAADAATATPSTLILPPGWFQSGAFIEVVTDRHHVATMATLLEKGSDFDRGTVTLI